MKNFKMGQSVYGVKVEYCEVHKKKEVIVGTASFLSTDGETAAIVYPGLMGDLIIFIELNSLHSSKEEAEKWGAEQLSKPFPSGTSNPIPKFSCN